MREHPVIFRARIKERDVARRRWISGRCNLSRSATIRLGVRNHRELRTPLRRPTLARTVKPPFSQGSSTCAADKSAFRPTLAFGLPDRSRYVSSHRPALIYLRFLFVDSSAVLRERYAAATYGNSVGAFHVRFRFNVPRVMSSRNFEENGIRVRQIKRRGTRI